jgi:predicted ATPase
MLRVLAGRDEEVSRLRGFVADLPERSDAVLVVGEAGIGKSALVDLAWIRGRAADRSAW